MERKIRLLIAVAVSMLLAVVTLYTSIKGGDVKQPVMGASELVSSKNKASKTSVVLDGIAAGPLNKKTETRMEFFVTDRNGSGRVLVKYEGIIPETFKLGRNVIVEGKVKTVGDDIVFDAKSGTLVTKCPSKYESGDESGKSKSSA